MPGAEGKTWTSRCSATLYQRAFRKAARRDGSTRTQSRRVIENQRRSLLIPKRIKA
jgi:hypothetical protein